MNVTMINAYQITLTISAAVTSGMDVSSGFSCTGWIVVVLTPMALQEVTSYTGWPHVI